MLRIRRIDSALWRDRVYALRYKAYRRSGSIAQNTAERFSDAFDRQPNHMLRALTDGDEVVGSARATWHLPDSAELIPEQTGYAEAVQAVVPSAAVIFSGNRFVTDPDRDRAAMPYAMLLLKYFVMAADAGGCDWAVAAVRAQHLPFYRRVLRLNKVSEGRNYPGLNAVMYLTACNFPNEIEKVYRARPSLRPSTSELALLDPTQRATWELGVPLDAAPARGQAVAEAADDRWLAAVS